MSHVITYGEGGSPVDPASKAPPALSPQRKIPDFRTAAFKWFGFGFGVIPVIPGTKQTALKWDSWLENLSGGNINSHWTQNPDHEIGFILGEVNLVLDADSPQSIAALADIEKACDVTPNLTVKTSKGVHHFFKLAKGTFAKTDSHSTELYSERIDVKARRSMVILPPSTGKELEIDEAESVDDLTEVGQDFIDAVFRHNGRLLPRPPALLTEPRLHHEPSNELMAGLAAMISKLNPDCGREDWIHIGMAVFHETGGSEEGFALWDAWSGKGSKYPGEAEMRVQWGYFRADHANPITIATIRKMVMDAGFDWIEVCAAAGEQFEYVEEVIIEPVQQSAEVPAPRQPVEAANALDKFSLRGMSGVLEKQVVEEVPVLGQLALMGQCTAFYGPPNTGKTLIILFLLIIAIKDGRVDPAKIYYINVDDSLSGLIQKLTYADEYGFQMLAEGYKEFKARELSGVIVDLIEKDQANGVIVILDTLKKFVDLMDKSRTSNFTKLIRGFVMKGGTVIALAHTNKNPGANGKLVPGGTSDIRDDFDCAYVMAPTDKESGERVVEFRNVKARGNVLQRAAYSFSQCNDISYTERLLSVQPVGAEVFDAMKQAEATKTDTEVIVAVRSCILEGITTKMMLADAAAAKAGISRRSALKLIEKYTGSDSAVHQWGFSMGERGAKIFKVLQPVSPAPKPET